jgi:hypothetical protein
MAMLGLLELMAANGVSEEEMYSVALKVNAYWFPGQYLAIAQFLESNGMSWEKANPKEILGASYSSGAGYKQVAAALEAARNPSGAPRQQSGGGSCGV